MKIILGSDHRGFKLKNKILNYLNKKGKDIVDMGTYNEDSTDYPIYAFKVGEEVVKNNCLGIVICASGIGISIACNKVKGVRCAKINNEKEILYSRNDNNTNVVAISGTMSFFKAKKIINTFINTPFSDEERHINRINMISKYEEYK